jgi:hypothetical protein
MCPVNVVDVDHCTSLLFQWSNNELRKYIGLHFRRIPKQTCLLREAAMGADTIILSLVTGWASKSMDIFRQPNHNHAEHQCLAASLLRTPCLTPLGDWE